MKICMILILNATDFEYIKYLITLYLQMESIQQEVK